MAAATPRALLRARVVQEALARQLGLVALEAVEVSAVDLVVEEVAVVASGEATVEASEADLAAVAVTEVALVVAAVALATKVRLMVLLPVLEDHEVGLAAAAVATAATVEATVEATATVVVTGVEEATVDPAVLITSRSAEIDTTTATPVEEAETAMVAAMIRGNVPMRATATTTAVSAGGTRHLRKLWYAPRWVCQRLPPISSFYLLRHRG